MSPGPVRVPAQSSEIAQGIAKNGRAADGNRGAELDPEERIAALVRGWIRRRRTRED
jgi:hypothetical protein